MSGYPRACWQARVRFFFWRTAVLYFVVCFPLLFATAARVCMCVYTRLNSTNRSSYRPFCMGFGAEELSLPLCIGVEEIW